MTDELRNRVLALRREGLGISKIARELDIPADTVRTFLNRYNKRYENRCLCCEKMIESLPHRKRKQFCSDRCRLLWWNSHQTVIKRKTFYKYICPQCGKEFTAYGNAKRKYCSRSCFAAARRKGNDERRSGEDNGL